MSVSQVRRVTATGRREGRRSLAAYGPHARGARAPSEKGTDLRGDSARTAQVPLAGEREASDYGAAFALAMAFPLIRRVRRLLGAETSGTPRAGQEAVVPPRASGSEGAGCMKRKPSISSLETVSLDEATAYLDDAGGDELNAAYSLAWDRNRLDGSHAAPDEAEVHHALFLLCRARGRHAPSFDEMRVELRRRVAA